MFIYLYGIVLFHASAHALYIGIAVSISVIVLKAVHCIFYLKSSTLLVQLNDAFCKTHPWLAQKVCTSSAHAHIAAYGARHHERRSNGNRAGFRRQW